MIIKKMHKMAGPVASAAAMRVLRQDGSTGCGRKTAAFAKEIIDKYTKRLNHPFEPASLIFLEQMANGGRFLEDSAAVVIVTYRLLSWLIQNTGQSGLFSDHHSFVVQQVTGQLEQNLEMLKDSAPEAGRELEGYFLEYQKILKSGKARIEQISNLQERMHCSKQMQKQIQIQRYPLQLAQESTKNQIPFVMTDAFFANLKHWIRGNRLADYRQMWKQANERQIVRHKLKNQMQRFLQEADFIRQEEQLSDMIWRYGRDAVSEYFDQADLKFYEKLMPVLYVLSGRQGAGHSGDPAPDTGQKPETYQTSDTGQILEEYPAPDTGQILEEYQTAAEQLERLLEEPDEQTKVFLQETAAEYKKYFREYVRAVSEIRKISAVQEIAGWQEAQTPLQQSQSAWDGSPEQTDVQAQTGEDREVFTDAEVELLLQKKEGQAASKEWETAQLKLKLLAYREIAEQFCQEGSAALHQETLHRIISLLDQRLFLDRQQLAEYQKADRKLFEMLSQSDDVTQNILSEKAEEYQNLFYRYISSDQIRQETVPALENVLRNQETVPALENVRKSQETTPVSENFQKKQQAAADRILSMDTPKGADGEMSWMRAVQSGEYEILFSDKELVHLLQGAEADRMPDSAAAEWKTAEYKLNLLAYREAAQQVLQEFVEREVNAERKKSELQQSERKKSESRQSEVLQKQNARGEVSQDIVFAKAELQNAGMQKSEFQNAEMQKPEFQNTEMQKSEFQNTEMQKAELRNADIQKAELRNAELRSAEVQKAELRNAEMQKLEFQSIEFLKAKSQNAEMRRAELRNTEIRRAELRNTEMQKAELRNTEMQKAELRNTEMQKLELQNTALQNTALQNTALQNRAFQKETLNKIIQLADQVSGNILQLQNPRNNIQMIRESSGRMQNKDDSEHKTVRVSSDTPDNRNKPDKPDQPDNLNQPDKPDIRSILEQGSLPERKLLFLTAQKNIDELLIRLQETGTGSQKHATEAAAVRQQFSPRQEAAAAASYEDQNTTYRRVLVQLKNQLQQIGGQTYYGPDGWGFLMTKEADTELKRIMQQEEHAVLNIWKQKVQQSLTDFYHKIKKEEFWSQASQSSSFFTEWNPVFYQEEWQQLRSLVSSQQPDRERYTKRLDPNPESVPDSQRRKQESESVLNSQRRKQESESVLDSQRGKRNLESVSDSPGSSRHQFRNQHQYQNQYPQDTSTAGNIHREWKHILMDCEAKLHRTAVAAGSSQNQTAVAAAGSSQNAGFYHGMELLRKDIWKKAPDHAPHQTQYPDFTRPPQYDGWSHPSGKAATAQAQPWKEDPAVQRIEKEQAAIVHTQSQTKDADQLRRIVKEKELQQKQELQRLEGGLLDSRSELQAKAAQLDQVEKKLAAQEKELKLVRERQHTVRKQGKTVAERREMFHQLKEELQLERMRSGLV